MAMNEIEELARRAATRIDPATGARSGVFPVGPAQVPQGVVQPAYNPVAARVADATAQTPAPNPAARAALTQIPRGNTELGARIASQSPPIPPASTPAAPAATAPTPQVPATTAAATSATRAGPTISQFASRVASSPAARAVAGAGKIVGGIGAAQSALQAVVDNNMSGPERAVRLGVAGLPFAPVPGAVPLGLAANAAVLAADTVRFGESGQTATERLRAWLGKPPPAPVGGGGAPVATGNTLVDQIPGYRGANSPAAPAAPAAAARPAPAPAATGAPPLAIIPNTPAPSGPIAQAAQRARGGPVAAPAPAAPAAAPSVRDPRAPLPGTPEGYDPIYALIGGPNSGGLKAGIEKYNPATGVYEMQDSIAPLSQQDLANPATVLGKAQELAFAGRKDEAGALLKYLGIDTEVGGRRDVAGIEAQSRLGVANINADSASTVQSMSNTGQLEAERLRGQNTVAAEQERRRFLPVGETTDPFTNRTTKTSGFFDTRTQRTIGANENREILPSATYEELVKRTMTRDPKRALTREQAEALVGQSFQRGQ